MPLAPASPLAWTAELAYAVGLITTDGNLSSDGRHLGIPSKDRELRASAGGSGRDRQRKIPKRAQPTLEPSLRQGRIDSSPPLNVRLANRPVPRKETERRGAFLDSASPPAATRPGTANGSMRPATPLPGWWNLARHDGLKSRCPQGHAGSTPAPGTITHP